MIYQYIAPNSLLQEYVRDYLVAHFIFDKNQDIPFKPYSPKPEQTLTFLPRGSLTIKNPLTNETQQAPSISICGQQVSRFNFYLSCEYLMLRVHFHPGALYRLLRVPLTEFTDSWFDATSVINNEISQVNERLANCNGYAQMIGIVEDYLLQKIKAVNMMRIRSIQLLVLLLQIHHVFRWIGWPARHVYVQGNLIAGSQREWE